MKMYHPKLVDYCKASHTLIEEALEQMSDALYDHTMIDHLSWGRLEGAGIISSDTCCKIYDNDWDDYPNEYALFESLARVVEMTNKKLEDYL